MGTNLKLKNSKGRFDSEVELFCFSVESKYFWLKQTPPPSPSPCAFEQASLILKRVSL